MLSRYNLYLIATNFPDKIRIYDTVDDATGLYRAHLVLIEEGKAPHMLLQSDFIYTTGAIAVQTFMEVAHDAVAIYKAHPSELEQQAFYDIPPSEEHLQFIRNLHDKAVALETYAPHQLRGDQSKDFYIGMLAAARAFITILQTVPPDEVLEYIERLSLDSAILIQKKIYAEQQQPSTH